MEGFTGKHLTGPLAEVAERLSQFLKRHGLDIERFGAHLRLDILTPREAWALRKFALISGGVGTAFINDLRNTLTPSSGQQTIGPIVGSGTLTGTAVDMIDADGPCFGYLVAGAVSAGTTAASMVVKYTECDTAGGTYADISGAVHVAVTASNKSDFIRYMRSKRFIKAVGTMSGTAPTVSIAVSTWGVLRKS